MSMVVGRGFPGLSARNTRAGSDLAFARHHPVIKVRRQNADSRHQPLQPGVPVAPHAPRLALAVSFLSRSAGISMGMSIIPCG